MTTSRATPVNEAEQVGAEEAIAAEGGVVMAAVVTTSVRDGGTHMGDEEAHEEAMGTSM